MNFIIGLIIFNVLVLGANFCFLLSGGPPWRKGEEYEPIRMGGKSFSVEKFAVGVSTSVIGFSWLVAWGYFLAVGWNSFLAQIETLWFHVATQFLASAGLVVAGYAIFRQWKRSTGIFLASMGLLVASVLIALVIYGPRGHGNPAFMYMVGMWTLVVGGYLTTATFLLDKLVEQKS